MVIAYIKDVARIDGLARKYQFRVHYYVEEACGREGCIDTCMGFDTTGEAVLELTLDQIRSQSAFNTAIRDALVAYVTVQHPFKHTIPEHDIVLVPTSF